MAESRHQPRTLSIGVPAYNEEVRLRRTVEGVVEAAEAVLDDYEIIVVNDGSRDGTRVIADELAASLAKVSAIHHPVNRGVGAAYLSVLGVARFPFISLVPGDNAFESHCLRDVYSAIGKADVIIPYRENVEVRSRVRLALSIVFSALMRVATRVPIRDGHGLFVWSVELARQMQGVPLDNRYHMTSLAEMLSRVSTYAEIPVQLTPNPDASSRTLRFKLVAGSAWTMLKMIFKYRISPRRLAPVPQAVRLDLGEISQSDARGRIVTSAAHNPRRA